jgi:hypothetical protein
LKREPTQLNRGLTGGKGLDHGTIAAMSREKESGGALLGRKSRCWDERHVRRRDCRGDQLGIDGWNMNERTLKYITTVSHAALVTNAELLEVRVA